MSRERTGKNPNSRFCCNMGKLPQRLNFYIPGIFPVFLSFYLLLAEQNMTLPKYILKHFLVFKYVNRLLY